MQIIYINHYAGSIHHGMEYRPYYLASEWLKLGYQVTIVASNYSHLRNKNVAIANNQSYLSESIDGINYIWCKTKPYKQNGIKRVFNIFEFLFKLNELIPKLIQLNPQYVIASSTYPFDTVLAKKIARKTGAKFIYEVHDLWPLTPIELGGMSKYHPFIWLMQRAENYGYKYADSVVSLLPCAKDYMVSHGLKPNKFKYIPNGVVCSDWATMVDNLPSEHQNIINQAKLMFNFMIGYAGGMGASNALEYLISVAQIKSNVAFILVGNGANKATLINQVSQPKLNNVFILPAINKAQIPAFLTQMDILYIGWHKLPIYRFGVSPNKLFDYMLAKKPILHSVTAGNDLVQEAGCGLSVEAENITAIADAVDKFMQMDKLTLEQLGNKGYNYVINNHDYKMLAQNFIKD